MDSMKRLIPILAALLLAAPALAQPMRQKASTARPVLFCMFDANGIGCSGLTDPTLQVFLSKNGAAFAARTATLGEVGQGWYSLSGANLAADLDTLGGLIIEGNAAGCLPGFSTYTIVEYDPFRFPDANIAELQTRLTALEANAAEMTLRLINAQARFAALEANMVAWAHAEAAALDSNRAADLHNVAGALDANAWVRERYLAAVVEANNLNDLHGWLDANIGRIGAVVETLSATSGTGANLVNVIVLDANGNTAIQGAKIRATLNTDTILKIGGADGNTYFTIGNGTWNLAASCPGYDGNSLTKTVSGNTYQVIKLNRIVVPAASAPDMCTVSVTFVTPDGNVAPGRVITYMLKSIPAGSGIAYVGTAVSATSNGIGVASATLWRGGVYEVMVGNVKVGADITAPAASSYVLPSIKVK